MFEACRLGRFLSLHPLMPTAGDNPFELNPFIELVMQSDTNKEMLDAPLRNPNVNPGELNPGVYYIGDLSYLDERIVLWEDCLSAIAPNDNWKNLQSGILKTPKGTAFASFSTFYGDGIFCDQYDYEYGVDSGRLGAFPISDEQIDITETGLGNIFRFEDPFTCSYDEETGVITFGDIYIDTKQF